MERTTYVHVRASKDELAIFQDAAELEGMDLSNWVRSNLLRVARETKREATNPQGRSGA